MKGPSREGPFGVFGLVRWDGTLEECLVHPRGESAPRLVAGLVAPAGRGRCRAAPKAGMTGGPRGVVKGVGQVLRQAGVVLRQAGGDPEGRLGVRADPRAAVRPPAEGVDGVMCRVRVEAGAMRGCPTVAGSVIVGRAVGMRQRWVGLGLQRRRGLSGRMAHAGERRRGGGGPRPVHPGGTGRRAGVGEVWPAKALVCWRSVRVSRRGVQVGQSHRGRCGRARPGLTRASFSREATSDGSMVGDVGVNVWACHRRWRLRWRGTCRATPNARLVG